MPINIALCEDEFEICNYFKSQLEKAFFKYKMSVKIFPYQDPVSLLHAISEINFQIYFLDIDLPNLDGITLGTQIRQMTSPSTCILFLSNKEDMVFRSFSVQPLRFIRKDHFFAEIDESITAILNFRKNHQPATFTIETDGKLLSLSIPSIQYIESYGRNQLIHYDTHIYKTNSKLCDMEHTLEQYGFLKIHKSYLVNYRFIFSIEKNCIILDNHQTLPLSKYRVNEVKKLYHKWISLS